MAQIDDIISVSTTVESSALTRAGFGTPAIFGVHPNPNLALEFGTDAAELVAAGIPATNPCHIAYLATLAANPRIKKVKILKRTTLNTQTMKIVPTLANAADADVGKVVSFNVRTPGGSKQLVSHTIVASDTVALQIDALKTAFDALSLAMTSVDNGTSLDITSDTAGALHFFSDPVNCDVTDDTPDPGLAADLTAARALDDDFYGVTLDSHGRPELEALATAVESLTKIHAAQSIDSDIVDGGSTTDIAAVLNSATRNRTFLLKHSDPGAYGAANWMGVMFAKTAGNATWKFKELGVAKDTFTTAQRTALKAKKANWYSDIKGLGTTCEGWMSGGRYIDIVRGIDALDSAIQEDLFAALHSQDKVPYDEEGIRMLGGILDATLRRFARPSQRFLQAATIIVTPPALEDIAAIDVSNRLLPDLNWSATGAGAIHGVDVVGKVTF